jgi:hypothetical protein
MLGVSVLAIRAGVHDRAKHATRVGHVCDYPIGLDCQIPSDEALQEAFQSDEKMRKDFGPNYAQPNTRIAQRRCNSTEERLTEVITKIFVDRIEFAEERA